MCTIVDPLIFYCSLITRIQRVKRQKRLLRSSSDFFFFFFTSIGKMFDEFYDPVRIVKDV